MKMISVILKFSTIMLLLVVGCAGQENIQKEQSDSVIDSTQLKKEAMDHFISGSLHESKGDYAAAILEYQEALAKDKSPGIYYSLAKNYFSLGKYPLALQNVKKAVELSPGDIEYYGLLGDIYTFTHQPDSAALIYEKMVSLDSSNVNALYRLAGVYEKSKPSEAVKIYNRILMEVGPEWNVLARLSELNEKLGNLTEAAGNLRTMSEIDPSNTMLRMLLAEIYVKDKNYQDALNVLQDMVETDPKNHEARERIAQLYIEQGDWLRAAEEYKVLLNIPGISLETKLRIGGAYFVQSLKDSTLRDITKEIFTDIDADTSDWQAKLFLGGIALNERNDSAAEYYFKEVIDLATYNSEGWIRLGGLYFDNQKYEEAIKLLTEAIDLYPKDFVINLLLGLSYSQTGNHTSAAEYLEISVEQNGKDLTALTAYAYTLSQLKQNEEAVIYLKRALRINPDDVNVLGTLGLIYDALEMWAECDSTYERALEIDSVNALVNNNYAYSLSERDIQLERALKMAQLAIAAEPYNSSYLDTIGWVYFKLGQYEDAEKYIRKALDVASDKAVLLEHLGDVLFKKGDKGNALNYWQKAYALDNSNTKLKTKIDKGEI